MFFNDSLPSRGVNNLQPASKGEVQEVQSENDHQDLIINRLNLTINQQNLIINQLVKQVNALSPVSTVVA